MARMSASKTEQRDFAQPIDRVYEICCSEAFLLRSGGTLERPVTIVDSRYEHRDDGSVFSEATAEQVMQPPEDAGEDAEPKTLRMTQSSTVFPLENDSFRIESEASLPGNTGRMSITFRYSALRDVAGQSGAGHSVGKHAESRGSEAGQSKTNQVNEKPLGCHVEAKATAKSRIPVMGRKLEKSVVSSLGSSLDRTIERINDLAAETWG